MQVSSGFLGCGISVRIIRWCQIKIGSRVKYHKLPYAVMREGQEWANLLAEVFDKLTQKHASITYDFENLEMKGIVGKEDKAIPTGTVSLTGKLTITAK